MLEISGNGDEWQNGSEAFCVSFMLLLLLVMMFSLKIVLMTLKRHK